MRFKDEDGKLTNDCWLWALEVNGRDYGRLSFWNGEKSIKYVAHRAIYEALVGPIPEGLTLDHLCRTPRCVNPAHLEPVTIRENILRGFRDRPRKTHCKRGHPFENNSYIKDGGRRNCAICTRAYSNERYRKYGKSRVSLVKESV